MGLLSKPTIRKQLSPVPVPAPPRKSPPAAQPGPVLVTDRSYPARPKGEDRDVEMIDAPLSATSSRNSPTEASKAGLPFAAGRTPSRGGVSTLGINVHGKRPREATITDERVAIKKVRACKPHRLVVLGDRSWLYHLSVRRANRTVLANLVSFVQILQASPLQTDQIPNLDGASTQHAARPAPVVRPPGAAGVLPPRKKAPVDPFIPRKPPRRK
jgi:senataxin